MASRSPSQNYGMGECRAQYMWMSGWLGGWVVVAIAVVRESRAKAEKMPIYELACGWTHGNHIFWSYLWTIKPVSLCACQWVVSWHLFRLFLARRGSRWLRMLRADGKYFSVHLMSNLRWARNFWSNKRAAHTPTPPHTRTPHTLRQGKTLGPYINMSVVRALVKGFEL